MTFDRSSSTAHTVTLGWERAISPRAAVAIAGGPRVTNGLVTADVAASVSGRIAPFDLSAAYARSEITAVGLIGTVAMQSVTSTAALRVGQSLRIQLAPAIVQSRQAALEADVYRITLDVVRPFANRLSLVGGFTNSVQYGNLYAAEAYDTIPRRTITVQVVAAPAGDRR